MNQIKVQQTCFVGHIVMGHLLIGKNNMVSCQFTCTEVHFGKSSGNLIISNIIKPGLINPPRLFKWGGYHLTIKWWLLGWHYSVLKHQLLRIVNLFTFLQWPEAIDERPALREAQHAIKGALLSPNLSDEVQGLLPPLLGTLERLTVALGVD